MSYSAQRWAAERREPLTTVEAFVLEVMAYHADEREECWPSMGYLARRVRVHRSTVYRALQRLEGTFGLVRKVQSGSSKGQANRYRLNVDKPLHLPAELSEHQTERLAPPELPTLDLDDLGEGVAHRDTPVASGATPEGVARRDTPVASDGRGGVASDATPIVRESSMTITATPPPPPLGELCPQAGRHVDFAGELTDCEGAGCRFRLSTAQQVVNAKGLAAARRALEESRAHRDAAAGSDGARGAA